MAPFKLFKLSAVPLRKVIRSMGILEFIEFSILTTKCFELSKKIKYDTSVVSIDFTKECVNIEVGDCVVRVIRFDRLPAIRSVRFNIESTNLGGHDCEKFWTSEEVMYSAWDHKEPGVIFWLWHFRDVVTEFDPLRNINLICEEMDRDQSLMLIHLPNRIYEYGWQNCTITSYNDTVCDEEFLWLTLYICPENSVKWILNPPRGFMDRFRFTAREVYFEHGHRIKLITIKMSTSLRYTLNKTAMSSKDMNSLIRMWWNAEKALDFFNIEIPFLYKEEVVEDLPVRENKDKVEHEGHLVDWMLSREDGKTAWIYFDDKHVVFVVV